MEPGLRTRKRIKTMAHIQTVAMRLFVEKGYRAVTMEQIAHSAEVAPATVYRYFETKTGFFTLDPVERPGYDNPTFVRRLLEDPVSAIQTVFTHIINEDDESTFIAGMQFVLEVPEVRAAVLLKNVQMADDIALQLVAEAGLSEMSAKSFARSLFIRVFTAMEMWHRDGRKDAFESCLASACEGLQAPGS